jgi:L-fuconolactonase
MKIDSHHHFWHYDPMEYGWIDEAMNIIRRDFLPEHLRAEMAAVGVDGVVSVQARQCLAETQWLLDLAAQSDFIRGVVGWVNLVSPSVGADLERFSQNAKLKSVRHVVQGEPDDDFILREDFNRGVSELKRFNLAYDILIFERHLPQTIKFVDAHPNQVFVLDHIAKPRIKDQRFEPWKQNLRELAKRPYVYCKISGLVTEANYTQWTEAQLRPYFETVLEVFGPSRLMFGSDWPVCLVACGYARWHKLVSGWISQLTAAEQARILGGTACAAYQL